MLSRALRLAAVGLLIGTTPVLAQVQNLEAGKSPAQIFAGTCTACHKAPRGLLKTVAPGSLPGFLRQHYTTSSEMASLLAGFLVSNGAADTRYAGSPKGGKDEKPEARAGGAPDQLDRFGRRFRPGPQEAAKPEADPREAARTEAPVLESQRSGRNARRFAPPADIPAAENQEPAQAGNERGPDGRRLSAKQKLSKRGKPGGEESPRTEAVNAEAGKEEPPKSEAAQTDTPKIETAKSETAKSETAKSETASAGDGKPEAIKPSAAETRSEPVKLEASRDGNSESPAARPDPVPQVTPAPAVAAAISGGTGETSPVAPQTQPQTLTASAPPPVPPAGPPAPPISR
jgi:hypothetical protein